MASEKATEDYLQELRDVYASSSTSSNDSTISVTPRLDKKTREHILLWKDIQKEVKNADHVKNGKASVYFMRNDDFEE